MENGFKRFLSLALAVLLVLSNVPVQAFASEVDGCAHPNGVSITSTAAACTTDGSTTITCPDCGDTTEVLPATGHSYVDDVCENCGEADPNAVVAVNDVEEDTPSETTPSEDDGLDSQTEDEGWVVDDTDYVAKIGDNTYATFAEAVTAATAMSGDVVVEIYGKVEFGGSLTGNYTSISFVGKTTDAEIASTVNGYIQSSSSVKVNFADLILSKPEGSYITNAGFMNCAFTVYQAGEVNYTNCTFSNGACASGSTTTYTGCTFHTSHDKYSLWAYGNTNVTVDGCTFADYRGIKMYAEGAAKTTALTVKNTNFSALTGKPAIVLTYGESVTLSGNTYSSTGVFELDLDGAPNGTAVSSTDAITCKNDNGACGVLVDGKIYTTVAEAAAVATSGSTVTLLHNSTETVELPEGVTLKKNGYEAANVTVAAPEVTYAAMIGGTGYATLAEAVTAASTGDTIVLYADVDSMPSIDKPLTIKGATENAGIEVNCAIAENFPNVDGTVTFENLTFNERISTENASNDQSKMTLKFVGCTFNVPAGNTYAIQAGASWNNDVLGALVVENCNFTTAATSFTKGYMVYAQCVENVTVKNSTFDGSNVFRGAIHLGDSTAYATDAAIEGNTIKNIARGVQVGNRVEGTELTISDNTFENVAAIEGETESATVYIHEVANAETTEIAYTNNEVGNSLVIFSENATGAVTDFVTSFEGNTKNETAIELEGNYSDTVYVPETPAVSGTISQAYTEQESDRSRIWGEITGMSASESVVIKLYSDDTLLATTTLTNESYLSLSDLSYNIVVGGRISNSWNTAWEEGHPVANVVPNKVVLYIDGIEMNSAVVTMDSKPDKLGVVTDWTTLQGVKPAPAAGPVEVATYDELVAALANGGEIKLTADITVDQAITVIDGTTIDLNEKTLYVNVENSYYNNATIKNGNIVLGKDDVHVCDGYFLVNEGKTLVLDSVNMTSAEGGIKGYAVFHLKTGANLDLINSTLNISDNEYTAGYIVYAGEATATVDVTGTTITGSNVNGIVHAATTIDKSTVTLTDVVEHGINRSGVTIKDSTVTISGGTGRGITAQHGDLEITGNSVVTISDMGEATIELRNDKNLTVAEPATVTLDAAVNNTTSGTVTGNVTVKVTPAGDITTGYVTANFNNSGKSGIFGEAVGVVGTESFEVKLYSGETLVGTAKLVDNDKVLFNGESKSITWHILTTEDDDSWWDTDWVTALNVNQIPDKVELYVDGVLVSTGEVELNNTDLSAPIVAAVTDADGKVQSFVAGTGYLNGTGENVPVYNEALQTAFTAGGNIVMLRDVTATEVLPVGAAMTLDLNGHTVSLPQLKITSDIKVEIKNGTLVGTSADYDTIRSEVGTLTLTDVNVSGLRHTVRIKSGTATINGGEYTYGGTKKVNMTLNVINVGDDENPTTNIATVTIKDGTFIAGYPTTYDGGSAVKVQKGSTVTIEGGNFSNGYNTLNADDGATLSVTGGIYDQDPTAYVAEDYAALPNLNDQYVVGEKPTATVNNLGKTTVAAGDYMVYGNGDNTAEMPLSFVMQFLADQTEEDMATSPYADWYGDFVITFTGIENGSFTADGCYLAGHYGTFGWVKVPVDSMTIKEGERYPVMLGVGMGQKYDYICSGVQDFKCALYLTPEVLEANPNLQVNLELSIVDNSQGSDAAAKALSSNESIYKVTDYTYRADDFLPAVAKIGNTNYLTLADAIAAVGAGDVVIELLKDATLDYNAREAYGTADTTSLTINGNGNTLTLNQKNSDWSSIGLANADAKLVLNNMTIEKTGYGDTSGAWNTHAINFTCEVEMDNVTVNNSMSVQDGATLNNVTINETGDYYGLWIKGNGQTVTVTNGEINGGRGIKIADEYVNEDVAKVTLSVTDTKFNTAKKAAVLVSSTAGADITASNVDIDNVAEDKVNFVWVDEDWAANYGNVTVTGATMTQEELATFNAAIVDENGNVKGYYKTLQNAIDACVEGNNIVKMLTDSDADVTILQKAGINITIDGDGKTFSGTMNVHGNSNYGSESATIQNVTFETTEASHTFIWSDSQEAPARYAHNVSVKDCTFTATGAGKNSAVALRFRQAQDIKLIDCTASGLHSAVQSNSDNGFVVDGLSAINCKNGVSFTQSKAVTVKNSYIKATGYGIRGDGSGDYGMTVKNSTVSAELPIVVRKTTGTFTLNAEGNTLTASNTEGYQVIFTNGDDGTYDIPAGTFNIVGDQDLHVFPFFETQMVAKNQETNATYDTVNAALAEAESGQTVIMLTDSNAASTMVPDGVTLDLNGNTYTVSYMVVFNGAHVVDNSDDNAGCLDVDPDKFMINEENTQMPVKTTDGYMFVDVINFNEKRKNVGYYVAQPFIETTALDELKSDLEATGISIVIRVSWTKDDTTRTQDFAFNENQTTPYFNSYDFANNKYGKQFSLKLTGLESDTGFSYQMIVVSDTGVEKGSGGVTN